MIGKVIATLLKDNAALLALVDTDSIFPYIINEGTAAPAIVYMIDKIDADYTKDGWAYDEVTFSVGCVAKNYSDLQDIAYQIRAALEFIDGTTESITYWNILHEGQIETYDLSEEAFLNKQTFSTKVVSYS